MQIVMWNNKLESLDQSESREWDWLQERRGCRRRGRRSMIIQLMMMMMMTVMSILLNNCTLVSQSAACVFIWRRLKWTITLNVKEALVYKLIKRSKKKKNESRKGFFVRYYVSTWHCHMMTRERWASFFMSVAFACQGVETIIHPLSPSFYPFNMESCNVLSSIVFTFATFNRTFYPPSQLRWKRRRK